MEASMVMRSPLDDNDTARTAWARYRRLMWGMAIVSLVAVAGALLYLRWSMGDALTIHMLIATAAGVGLSVLLGAALMGLVFLRSEERRVGKECGRTCRSRGSPDHKKK